MCIWHTHVCCCELLTLCDTHVHKHTHTHTQTHAQAHSVSHTYSDSGKKRIRSHAHTHTNADTRTCLHVHTHTSCKWHTHTSSNTHTYRHTHTQRTVSMWKCMFRLMHACVRICGSNEVDLDRSGGLHCVYVNKKIHVCMEKHIYICIHTYIYIHTYMHTCRNLEPLSQMGTLQGCMPWPLMRGACLLRLPYCGLIFVTWLIICLIAAAYWLLCVLVVHISDSDTWWVCMIFFFGMYLLHFHFDVRCDLWCPFLNSVSVLNLMCVVFYNPMSVVTVSLLACSRALYKTCECMYLCMHVRMCILYAYIHVHTHMNACLSMLEYTLNAFLHTYHACMHA
jgi:hypothetical protein